MKCLTYMHHARGKESNNVTDSNKNTATAQIPIILIIFDIEVII